MSNTTAVIVALPRAMDPIRLVGAEDKHATLLFFGETASLPSGAKSLLTGLVERASKMFFPFEEDILDVVRLGSDTPPALVAKLSGRTLSPIRNALMIESSVNDYLKNADQHPQFTPHVTLDYPDYAEEQKLRELVRQLYRVQFDRLALWWNDDHFEFNLGPADLETSVAAAHSDFRVQDFLAHHGIKGMHWGVRRSRAEIDAAKSEDHKRVEAVKAKAKSTKVSSLSNKELQDAIQRMNLEQQYARLSNSKTKSAGHKFVAALLGNTAKQQANRVANDYATKKVDELLKNK